MIKGITGGVGVTVQNGGNSYPYVPMNSNNPIQGMIRINGQDTQVFDGSSWLNLGTSYASVNLDSDTLEIINWARKAMEEDRELERLAKENPAVNAALENMRRAQKQLKTTIILSRDEKTTS
jgi:hypothetical protein